MVLQKATRTCAQTHPGIFSRMAKYFITQKVSLHWYTQADESITEHEIREYSRAFPCRAQLSEIGVL